jgi:hypothetical protein
MLLFFYIIDPTHCLSKALKTKRTIVSFLEATLESFTLYIYLKYAQFK